MPLSTRSVQTTSNNSIEAGREVASSLLEPFERPPQLVLCYLTVNHDQPAFLRGMRETLGEKTCLLGCSAQGVMGRGSVREEGYLAGAIAFGGSSVEIAGGHVTDIHTDTYEKGRALGRQLVSGLRETPKVAVLHYDPLCGTNMDPFLGGLSQELGCPIIGGAAGHFYGPMRKTFQYFDQQAFSRGAIALAMCGDFTPVLAISTGVSPVGIEMTVTRCDQNVVLELDGRRALDVWQEITAAGPPNSDHTAALALGVPVEGSPECGEYLIRAAFGVDGDRGGVVLQAGIPEGTQVMLHHRTVDDVLQGTRRMARELRERLNGRTVRAVLGFECGARTAPFLGEDATRDENTELQEAVAKDAEWLGLVAWGEIYPVGGRPGFHNYTYPVLAIAD